MGYGYLASPAKIRQDYLMWLGERVGAEKYSLLMNDLQKIPFKSYVDHDENRAADGLTLRERYLEEAMWANGEEALEGDCTMLEMLIALSERMAFEMSSPLQEDPGMANRFFWELIRNMSMICYTDDRYVELGAAYEVPEIVSYIIERQYSPNGFGGLFPLRDAAEDQRKVELWYQMQAYLRERYDENDIGNTY